MGLGAWKPSQGRLLTIALLTLLGVSVGVPLVTVLLSSLKPDSALPFDAAPISLQHYATVFLNSSTWRLLGNTALYAGATLLFGLPLAFLVAWLLERTDMPLAGAIQTSLFVPLAMPGMITAFGWVLLLNPRNGVINGWLRSLTGGQGEGPVNVYSLAGMIFVTVLGVTPTMVVLLSGLLRNFDPTLEEAARMSGASGLAVLRRVAGPLAFPGLLATAIAVAVVMIELFDIPLVIGLTSGTRVLATQIYAATRGDGAGQTYGLAATYGLIGLVIGAALMQVYGRVTRTANKYSVIGGKAFQQRRQQLGAWRWAALGLVVLVFILEVVLPFALLIWASLLRFYQPPSMQALSQVSLGRYAAVFVDEPRVGMMVTNTLLLIGITSTVVMVLSVLVSWSAVRDLGVMGRLLDSLSFAPLSMPALLIALALLLVSIGTPLQGTLAIIIIGLTIRYLPFGARLMNGAILQIKQELEEAATMSGAGISATLRRIVVPLVSPALFNGWLWVAAHAVRDLTFPLFLISANNLVISGFLWEYWAGGRIAEGSAIAVVQVLFILLLVLPARFYAGATGMIRT